MANTPLSDIFHITKRFQRSVHLARDFYTENALDGYVVTVKARETLARLITARENEATSKAWSLTGPYGAGKSAFALFAAKLFGNTDTATTKHALKLLKHSDPPLYERFLSLNGNREKTAVGFCPVLISGERASITHALLQGLEHGLQTFHITARHSLRKDIQALLKTEKNGNPLSATEVTALFESATLTIKKKGGGGLLLVVDELGKFLEHAAQHPAQGDVFVLQTLAEFATRSAETPLFFMTILHQAFEHYANRAAASQREEWAKVQGRFEDLAFVEPADQILQLIGSAIQNKDTEGIGDLQLLPASDLNLNPFGDAAAFRELLRNCLPLHPTVALLIGPVFRKFAQNERSLFAFLNAVEPHGLRDFLENRSYDGNTLPMFSIPDLYDYLQLSLGNRLYTSREGDRWLEVEMAINRLADPSPLLVKLIKTIGLLGIVGEVSRNLNASEGVLRYALDDQTAGFKEEFSRTLEDIQARSIVIHRRHNKTYALWEGSDINIEERLQHAEGQLNRNERLMTYLSDFIPPRPLIARRHLFEKGTLRYFTVRYTDLDNFEDTLAAPLDSADGLVLYALPGDENEGKQILEKAKRENLESREEVLLAMPTSTDTLYGAVRELACLHWVSQNTEELEGDKTARRELAIRSSEAERSVSEEVTSLFKGKGGTDNPCQWYHKGKEIPIKSLRERNGYLSEICDAVYPKTPVIRHELINRRKVSGAVTTARRKLIQAMLEKEAEDNLGIEGYPAEMSIYRSLLLETGIHRQIPGSDMWRFHPPSPDATNDVRPIWEAIEQFLETCEDRRQPLPNLYTDLMKPPIGAREGPLPILLCAVILHYKTEIALYENGSFIPNWTIPVFERLIKRPERFELKRFRMTDIRADLFPQFLGALDTAEASEKPDLLTVVVPLVQTISELPQYTRTTQELSEAAQNLRATLGNAREPDELLFKQLPAALGFPAFKAETATDPHGVSQFFGTLQGALSELNQAYDRLLDSLEEMLATAFDLTSETLRDALVCRAEVLLPVAIETDLKGFLINIHSGGHDFKSWLVALASYLAKKPPDKWLDTDKAQFQNNLSHLARKFRHLEAVSYDQPGHTETSTGEAIRIGITTRNQPEQEQVVTLPATAEAQAVGLERAIETAFDELDAEKNHGFRLAVLARISQKLMQAFENERAI